MDPLSKLPIEVWYAILELATSRPSGALDPHRESDPMNAFFGHLWVRDIQRSLNVKTSLALVCKAMRLLVEDLLYETVICRTFKDMDLLADVLDKDSQSSHGTRGNLCKRLVVRTMRLNFQEEPNSPLPWNYESLTCGQYYCKRLSPIVTACPSLTVLCHWGEHGDVRITDILNSPNLILPESLQSLVVYGMGDRSSLKETIKRVSSIHSLTYLCLSMRVEDLDSYPEATFPNVRWLTIPALGKKSMCWEFPSLRHLRLINTSRLWDATDNVDHTLRHLGHRLQTLVLEGPKGSYYWGSSLDYCPHLETFILRPISLDYNPSDRESSVPFNYLTKIVACFEGGRPEDFVESFHEKFSQRGYFPALKELQIVYGRRDTPYKGTLEMLQDHFPDITVTEKSYESLWWGIL